MFRSRSIFVATLVTLTLASGAQAQQPQQPQAADAPETARGEYTRLLNLAVAQESPVLGLAQLDAATRLTRYVPASEVRRLLDSAVENAKAPEVRFELIRALTRARLEARDYDWGYDGMEGPLAQQGCLLDWQVIGPFSNDNSEGLATPYEPESGVEGPFEGSRSDVAWRTLPDDHRYCVLALSTVIQPSNPSVVYLSTKVDSTRRQDALLNLGVNGAYRVWLNGEPVAERTNDQGLRPGNDAWRVRLNQGENSIVLKIASTSDGSLGAIARLTDTRQRPLVLQTSAARNEVQLEPEFPEQPTNLGILAQLEFNAETFVGEDAVWNAWLWRHANWRNVATPWRDIAEQILGEVDALSPRMHALVAELYEDYWRRVAIVEAAHARAPADPWIAMALANILEESINEVDILRARQIMVEVVEANPNYLYAWARLSDWDSARGFEERARALLDRYKHSDRMQTPAFFSRWVDLAETLGPAETLHDLYRTGLEFMAVTGGYWWKLVDARLAREALDDALKLVREYRKVDPGSRFAATREAQILRAQGKMNEAVAIVDAMVSRTPGDSSLLEMKAEYALAAGDRDAALEALEAARVQRPQDTQIRDYISFLQPQDALFWEPWMVDDVWEIARSVPGGSFNYDTVLEQTVIEVAKNGLAREVRQRVDRVLTADGIDSAKTNRIPYQAGDETVDVLRVRVHKADGTVSEDFQTWSSGGSRKGNTTYNDTAYMNVRANDVEVGDLVEVRWRRSQVANSNFRGDYFGDISYVQGSRPIGLSRYTVLYPDDWTLHFRPPALEHERLDDTTPDGTTLTGVKSTSFELRQVPHAKTDSGQPGATDVYDYILVSNKETYDEIGRWWWSLIEEQLIVDDAIASTVRDLTRNARTDDEKVRAIHNHVVKNTRYLHVGLGIHGWKPYRTTTAFRNRYGDCKDKAALLKVMLEQAGIDAELVLVRTRRLGEVDSYPASMHVFNHAITYVPDMDIYLDATAEFNGTRELTPMDQGAQALVVKDGGSATFLKLPVDEADDNTLTTRLEVDLTGDEPSARGRIEATGANAVYLRSSLQDPERRDENFEKQLASTYPGAQLISATYSNLDDLEAPTIIEFTFTSDQLLRREGAREFLLPMAESKNLRGAYARQSKRDQDLTIRVPFANETRVTYTIPAQKQFERVPEPVEIESPFGGLSIAYSEGENELDVSVRYSIDVQRISVEDYPAFRTFMSDATDALNETIGLASDE